MDENGNIIFMYAPAITFVTITTDCTAGTETTRFWKTIWHLTTICSPCVYEGHSYIAAEYVRQLDVKYPEGECPGPIIIQDIGGKPTIIFGTYDDNIYNRTKKQLEEMSNADSSNTESKRPNTKFTPKSH